MVVDRLKDRRSDICRQTDRHTHSRTVTTAKFGWTDGTSNSTLCRRTVNVKRSPWDDLINRGDAGEIERTNDKTGEWLNPMRSDSDWPISRLTNYPAGSLGPQWVVFGRNACSSSLAIFSGRRGLRLGVGRFGFKE